MEAIDSIRYMAKQMRRAFRLSEDAVITVAIPREAVLSDAEIEQLASENIHAKHPSHQ